MKRIIAITIAGLALLFSCAFALGDCAGGNAPNQDQAPVRKGDVCRVDGAVGTTNSGERVVCSRHNGMDYLTWGNG